LDGEEPDQADRRLESGQQDEDELAGSAEDGEAEGPGGDEQASEVEPDEDPYQPDYVDADFLAGLEVEFDEVGLGVLLDFDLEDDDPPEDPDSSPSEDEEEEEEEPNGHDRSSARFFLEHLDHPLYIGSSVTLIEQCFVLVQEKVRFQTPDIQVDRLCRWLNHILPAGNLQPPSLYLLKKCISCHESARYEQHVCVNDCCKFPKLSKSQYRQHEDEKCTKCQEPRFLVKHTSRGRVLRPRKVFWDFGLDSVIRDHFFTNPEFCGLRGAGRDAFQMDFYSSLEAERLDMATQGALRHADNSIWELGFDFCQCFTFKQYSVGVLALR
jgi:hypothetical protein